jgi:hypothetical protein
MKPRPLSPTPYFDTWLRRTRKQLTASGRLSQVAAVLAVQDGTLTAREWEENLRAMLEGQFTPGMDVLVRIDGVLAGSPKADDGTIPPQQLDFF